MPATKSATDHQKRVYDSIMDMLPNEENPSPLVRLNKMLPTPDTVFYAKLEWMNPFGSIKDRAAYFMIQALLDAEEINESRGIVEPTSGNTGLSLALMASALGIPSRAVVPNKIPLEKKILLKIAGAQLDVVNDALCPSPGTGDGSINLAKTYAKTHQDKWVLPNQYENEANVQAHINTTGPEIWRQTDGKITHLFLSTGTCGTLKGTSLYFKEKNPNVKIIAIKPAEGHDVPGLRTTEQLAATKFYDESLADTIIEVEGDFAFQRALELNQKEGLIAGPSSGLIYEGASRYALENQVDHGVLIFCDNIFKYISNMIRHIPELAEGTEV